MRRALSVSADGYGFGVRVPQTDYPNHIGVVELGSSGPQANTGEVPQWIKVLPIGIGNTNDSFSLRLTGWSRIGSGFSPNALWVPVILGEVLAALGTYTGVAGSPVLDSEVFAHAITVVTEATMTANVAPSGTMQVTSPGSGFIAHFLMPLQGYDLIEFSFAWASGQPVMNALYSLV